MSSAANEPLDAVQVELLRRINQTSDGVLDQRAPRRLVKRQTPIGDADLLSAAVSLLAVEPPVEQADDQDFP